VNCAALGESDSRASNQSTSPVISTLGSRCAACCIGVGINLSYKAVAHELNAVRAFVLRCSLVLPLLGVVQFTTTALCALLQAVVDVQGTAAACGCCFLVISSIMPLPGFRDRQSCHHHREQQAALSSQHPEHSC
jgi:hypothetical protein